MTWLHLSPIHVVPTGDNLGFRIYWGELELGILPDFCEVKGVLRLSATGDIHITYWSNITGYEGVFVAYRAMLDPVVYEKEMVRYRQHLESEFWQRLTHDPQAPSV